MPSFSPGFFASAAFILGTSPSSIARASAFWSAADSGSRTSEAGGFFIDDECYPIGVATRAWVARSTLAPEASCLPHAATEDTHVTRA